MYNERKAIECWRANVEAATMMEREEDFATDDSGEMSEESSDLLHSGSHMLSSGRRASPWRVRKKNCSAGWEYEAACL